jgi:hypothetical protein
MVNYNERYKIPPWDGRFLLENGRHWHLLEVKLHFRISHPNTLEHFQKVFMLHKMNLQSAFEVMG